MNKKRIYSILVLIVLCVELSAQSLFTLNAIGDVQVDNWQELEYANRTIFAELLSSDSDAINLFLGDQVNDNMDLMAPFKALVEMLPQESHLVLGNHDRDVDSSAVLQLKTFNELFGPAYYAFKKGNYHFIILNNVYSTGPRNYYGYISDEQLDYVKSYLSKVKKNEHLVFAMHIPFADTRNRKEFMEILKGRGNVLFLTGHSHEVQRFVFEGDGVIVNEVNVGATCGMWWRGELDWAGVPASIMQGGAPRGYFIFNFKPKSYDFRFKAVGLDEDVQMSLHIHGLNEYDSQIDTLQKRPKAFVSATVYGAYEGTSVRYRLDGGEWQTAVKQRIQDPNVARISDIGRKKGYPSAYSSRQPLRRTASNYIWTFQLPDDCLKGAHRVDVEASDDLGFRASYSRTFIFE